MHNGIETVKVYQILDYILHMKIRNGEKPYQCVQCDKAFSKQVSLSIHLRIHTGEKPLTCINVSQILDKRHIVKFI